MSNTKVNEGNAQLVAITPELAQSIANYLDTRPHREVRGLIDGLSSAQVLNVSVAQEAEQPEEKED